MVSWPKSSLERERGGGGGVWVSKTELTFFGGQLMEI